MAVTEAEVVAPSVSLLERAMDSIPERRDLKAAALRLRQPPPAEGPKGDRVAALVEEVAQDVIAGGDLPDNLGERALVATTAVERHRAAHAVWQQIRKNVSDELAFVESQGADVALVFLGERLDEVLAEVRRLDEVLGGIRSVDAALDAGGPQAAAWSELRGQVARYEEIRAAQLAVVVARRGIDDVNARRLVATVGTHRNYALLDPERAVREGSIPGSLVVGDDVVAPTSWPTDPYDHLRWLATSPDADPWVPSTRELEQAEQARVRFRQEVAQLRQERDHASRTDINAPLPTGPSEAAYVNALRIQQRLVGIKRW